MLSYEKPDQYVMCSDCGNFIKYKKVFMPEYRHGGIILCKDCAKKLYENLKDFLKDKGVDQNDVSP